MAGPHYKPIRGRVKPNNIRLRYDPNYWGEFGGKPSLDMPMFGPARKGGVNDYSPNASDGVLSGGAIWNKNYTAYPSTASAPVCTVSNPPYPLAPFSLVIECAYTTTNNLVIWEINGNSGWSLQVASAGLASLGEPAGSLFFNLNGRFTVSKSAWNDGNFHLVVITISSSGKVYVDGKNDTLSTATTTVSSYASAPMYFGSRNGSFTFGGNIREATVLPYTLSAAQVAKLYRDPWARFTRRGAVYGASAGSVTPSGLRFRRTRSDLGTRTGSRQVVA